VAVAFAVTAAGAGDWSLGTAVSAEVAGVAWALVQLGAGIVAAAAAVPMPQPLGRRGIGGHPTAAGTA